MPPEPDASAEILSGVGGQANGWGPARLSCRCAALSLPLRGPGHRERGREGTRPHPAGLRRSLCQASGWRRPPLTGGKTVSRRVVRALALTASALCVMAAAASAADASKVCVSNSAPAVAGGKLPATGFNTVQGGGRAAALERSRCARDLTEQVEIGGLTKLSASTARAASRSRCPRHRRDPNGPATRNRTNGEGRWTSPTRSRSARPGRSRHRGRRRSGDPARNCANGLNGCSSAAAAR